ncbi:hypothetical protein D3C72_1166720 [compost metagenome]
MDVARGVLDVGDDRGQLRRRGVGIAGNAAEHALEIAVHACTQATIGNGTQHRRDLAEVVFGGLHQPVQAIDHRAEVMLEARAVAALAEVACGSGFGQAADLAVDRTEVGFDRIQRLGDHGFFARQALHVQAEVAHRIAAHDRDRAHLHLDVRIDQGVGVGHHRAVGTGEGAAVHAVADRAGVVCLGHRSLRVEHATHRALHGLHRLRQATDLVAAAHLHLVVEIAGSDRTCGRFHGQHRLHHGTPQPPAQAHQQQHGRANGQCGAQQQRLPCLLRARGHCGLGNRGGTRAQGIQRAGRRTVFATHQRIAGRRIIVGVSEGLQCRVVIQLQLSMQAGKRLRQFTRARIGTGRQAFGQFGNEAAFAVEGLQVVLAQRVIVAAQQHVLPFLHLPAELTLQALGVAAVGDLRRDFGGQLQPGRRQARQGANQDNGQTNRNGAEQLRLQPRRMGRGFHGTRSRKGCDAVSTIL